MRIIAHRGNLFGKSEEENELLYLLQAVRAGFGVETDLIRAPCGRLIISHDSTEWTSTNDAALVLKNLIYNDAYIALNIKGRDLLDDLLKIVNPNDFEGFVFDFELCDMEPFPELYIEQEMGAYHNKGFKVAERCSDRGEKPTGKYDYIWLDEMDKSYSIDISDLDPKKIVYVSPELHGRPAEERRVDVNSAICTDYCYNFPK